LGYFVWGAGITWGGGGGARGWGWRTPPPPPPPEKTCQTSDSTQVMGDMRAEGQVTRETTVTRCVTQ